MSFKKIKNIPDNYFGIRDFEYSQFIYDLVYLSEIASLAEGSNITKFRLKSLSKAAYSIDGYSTQISDWLNGDLENTKLDYVPSLRIKKYLQDIKDLGSLVELDDLQNTNSDGCLRLRSIPRVKKKQIARLYKNPANRALVFNEIAATCNTTVKRIEKIYNGVEYGKWQKAHIFTPLFRFIKSIEELYGDSIKWKVLGINKNQSTIENIFRVESDLQKIVFSKEIVGNLLKDNPLFKLIGHTSTDYKIQHKMGWYFTLSNTSKSGGSFLKKLIFKHDPLINKIPNSIKSDLHIHSSWSDGLTPIDEIVEYSLDSGLEYIAITDHSRSSKVQGGLTPSKWLKQRRVISRSKYNKIILHGSEVDILSNGELDYPSGILNGMDIVIGSIHSGWHDNFIQNTNRIIKAIESGYIDILGHPTATVTGKPGVPNYYRPAINADWDKIFSLCAKWNVALEINCFPSRLDLSYENIIKAMKSGCWISLGSDAHSKNHLDLIKFGIETIPDSYGDNVLNYLSLENLKQWLRQAREARKSLTKSNNEEIQLELFEPIIKSNNDQAMAGSACSDIIVLPEGSDVIGLDLTSGANKKTGVAYLSGDTVETTSILSDNDIIDYIIMKSPRYVSIDSPLGLPGGTQRINPKAGIVRKAERDLSSVGIPAYPALIDSMKGLTLRGIKLREKIELLPDPPIVLESYPGAAQDILGIPRKQNGLNYLVDGLRQLGLTGPGLQSTSHDEIDAITCCVVGRFFESGNFEPMGVPSEAQLIVPKTTIINTEVSPIVFLSGTPNSGKSVIARYLVLFYGFKWIKISELLLKLIDDNFDCIASKRLKIDPAKDVTASQFNKFQKIIQNEYKQEPLKKSISKIIKSSNVPIVVDSYNFLNGPIDIDMDIDLKVKKPFTWHVLCSGFMVKSINAKKNSVKSKYKLLESKNNNQKESADFIIENNGTLEYLHRVIDDTLFNKMIKISRSF